MEFSVFIFQENDYYLCTASSSQECFRRKKHEVFKSPKNVARIKKLMKKIRHWRYLKESTRARRVLEQILDASRNKI